jgi:uncharacterized protein (TIGR00725 family)
VHFNDDGTKWEFTRKLAKRLIDKGYRILHGGLGDIARATAEGARESELYKEGDIVAALPGFDPADANNTADIVLGTGFDINRNSIVANADAIIAVGGGAGTLSELAFAWQLKRLILAFRVDGWSGKLCGTRLDSRTRYDGVDDQVYPVDDENHAILLLEKYGGLYTKRHHGIVTKD